ERAVALTRFDHVMVEDLPEKVQTARASTFVIPVDSTTEIISLDELERRYILRVFELVGGNKAHAARLLGLDRATLYRRLQRYGVEPAGG
ncbi:MAG TPA: helix-turn-helix domain-containing protein, partial [Planctomycetota bacterium]|nr:helix-turn-helix domain-containing protein [Planctomycetota bacterium]